MKCQIPESEKDDSGCVPFHVFVMSTRDCEIEAGSCFYLGSVPVDKHGHPVDDGVGSGDCVHDKKMETVVMSDGNETSAVTSSTPAPETGATTLTETIGVAPTAAAEIKQLMPADGNATGVTVALAVVSVAGGGAAFKLYQNLSRQKHEQRMKELDQKNDGHEQCAAQRVALEAKVSALETRLAEAEKAEPRQLELPFDVDELEDRLARIEKSLPEPAVKKTGGRKKKT